MIKSVLKLLLTMAVTAGAAQAQTMVVGTPNVYSPNMVMMTDKAGVEHLKMYFGGWNVEGQEHDNIYRSDCDRPDHCTLEQTVVFAENGGWTPLPRQAIHVNDPSIITVGNTMIMYMTVCAKDMPCLTGPGNQIWYAMSPVGDGLNWSAPVTLLESAWLPSAVVRPDGNVMLYGNSGDTGDLFMMNLGPDGTRASSRGDVNSPRYCNVEVRHNGPNDTYIMLGENVSGEIDALESYDGRTWWIVIHGIAKPEKGYVYIRTPAMHPQNLDWFYAAATQDNGYGEGNKIFAQKR